MIGYPLIDHGHISKSQHIWNFRNLPKCEFSIISTCLIGTFSSLGNYAHFHFSFFCTFPKISTFLLSALHDQRCTKNMRLQISQNPNNQFFLRVGKQSKKHRNPVSMEHFLNSNSGLCISKLPHPLISQFFEFRRPKFPHLKMT